MRKNNKKKRNTFKIILSYLKDEKLRLFIYILLVILTYIPTLLSSFFWGYAIEALVNNLFNTFLIYLLLREGMHILFYCVLAVPRDSIYNYFDIKFCYLLLYIIIQSNIGILHFFINDSAQI